MLYTEERSQLDIFSQNLKRKGYLPERSRKKTRLLRAHCQFVVPRPDHATQRTVR